MKELMKCTNCGEISDKNAMYEFDGNFYCEECFLELFTVCDECGCCVPNDDITLVNQGCSDERYICTDCLDRICFECDHCDRYYTHSHLWESDSSISICDGCSHHYYICYDCESIIHEDNIYAHRGEFYCQRCYEELSDDLSSYVNDYYYKPEPEFLGNSNDGLYIGVELEVDKGDAIDAAAKISKNYNDVYLKRDGSLSTGFEIVSHPATLDYHLLDLGWADIMNICLDNNMRSHDTSTCGLHCHVSRDFFGETQDEQDLHIAKLILLIDRFWDNCIVPFSRRNYDNLNRWAAKPNLEILDSDTDEEILDKVKKTKHYGRYQAINLQNECTVEFRIFRGTLKLNTFIATLQFVDCICRFAKKIRLSGICTADWGDLFIGTNYPELEEYLNEKNL